MPGGGEGRSALDPETSFRLIEDDCQRRYEKTGLECLHCGATAPMGGEFEHEPDCPQVDVRRVV